MNNGINQLQITHRDNQFYHIQLDGVLSSAEIKWNGEVSIVDQPEDQSILVCLVIHAEEIRRFIEYFQVISLSVDSEVASRDKEPDSVNLIDPDHEESYLNLATPDLVMKQPLNGG
jgi:hypothetical protein